MEAWAGDIDQIHSMIRVIEVIEEEAVPPGLDPAFFIRAGMPADNDGRSSGSSHGIQRPERHGLLQRMNGEAVVQNGLIQLAKRRIGDNRLESHLLPGKGLTGILFPYFPEALRL